MMARDRSVLRMVSRSHLGAGHVFADPGIVMAIAVSPQ